MPDVLAVTRESIVRL